jgi:predicted secreted protein
MLQNPSSELLNLVDVRKVGRWEGGRNIIDLAASGVWEDKESDIHLSKLFPDAFTLKILTTATFDVLEYLYCSMQLKPES